jgi:hypothetical protein
LFPLPRWRIALGDILPGATLVLQRPGTRSGSLTFGPRGRGAWLNSGLDLDIASRFGKAMGDGWKALWIINLLLIGFLLLVAVLSDITW